MNIEPEQQVALIKYGQNIRRKITNEFLEQDPSLAPEQIQILMEKLTDYIRVPPELADRLYERAMPAKVPTLAPLSAEDANYSPSRPLPVNMAGYVPNISEMPSQQ